MERHEAVKLETVLGLAEKLDAVEKLKLVERVLAELEPIVRAQEPKKQRPLHRRSKQQNLTEEQIKEVKRKLWGPDEQKWPTRVVKLGGLWKETSLNLTNEDFRQASHELSAALKRRAEKVL